MNNDLKYARRILTRPHPQRGLYHRYYVGLTIWTQIRQVRNSYSSTPERAWFVHVVRAVPDHG